MLGSLRSVCGVAMAIHSDWSVLRVMRDDRSCRAIGALLERSCDASRLLVINLYLPSNLDRLGCGSVEAGEAAELCELARTWVRRHAREAHGNVVLCGDFNQTLLPVTLSDGSRVWERTLAGKGVARDAANVLASWRNICGLFGPAVKRTLSISYIPLATPSGRRRGRSGASGLGTLPPALTMFLLPLRSRPRPPATLPSSPARIITVGLRAAGRRRTTRRYGLGSRYSWRRGGPPRQRFLAKAVRAQAPLC